MSREKNLITLKFNLPPVRERDVLVYDQSVTIDRELPCLALKQAISQVRAAACVVPELVHLRFVVLSNAVCAAMRCGVVW
jgi:hypothetical protein